MNTSLRTGSRRGRTLIASAVALTLTSCATAPLSPEGSAAVRTKLTQLQNDPTLGTLAPVAIKEAEGAVVVAEEPLDDVALGAHRVYIADRKVDIAIAQASTRHAEDQQAKIGEQREHARLDAPTREADAAHIAATDAQAQAAELQRQIDALQAEATDRGLVLTLGDVLFASGRAELKVGATDNLDKLIAFLNSYPNRSVMIEGHTDNQGSDDYNMGLSERRADSVKSYLMEQGISSQRLVASGKGEAQPLADNESESGRQQNRRVEVIIENAPPATASTSM